MPLLSWMLLGMCGGFVVVSLASYEQGHPNRAVVLLMGAALSLRIVLIGLDPFLHDWDERFHALVAKNMLADYLVPVLRATPVLPYDYRSWSSNHVWLHKQPLFLWQMALSMRMFGINEVALRFPSALLSTLLLWPIYRLGKCIFSPAVGYYAALLSAFAYYQLELTTGWQSVDHSDVSFLVYVTASVWAYYESQRPLAPSLGWSLMVGTFAGAAVLCKWLPGLVVYAAWAVDMLMNPNRRQQVREYGHLLSAAVMTSLMVLPWQFYIHFRFPLESAFEMRYAAQHFGHVLEGKDGPWHFYLIQNMWYQYQWLVLLVGIGLALLFTAEVKGKPVRPLLVSCGLMFGFYSLAATKMPSYTYVVAPCILLLAALAWTKILERIDQEISGWNRLAKGIFLLLVLAVSSRPLSLLKHHTIRFATSKGQLERRVKMRRTAVYRRLNALVPQGSIVFNAPSLTETEAMFYSNRNVYSWWPREAEFQRLMRQGFSIATFPNRDKQLMPSFLLDSGVLLIPAAVQ